MDESERQSKLRVHHLFGLCVGSLQGEKLSLSVMSIYGSDLHLNDSTEQCPTFGCFLGGPAAVKTLVLLI